VSLRLPAIDAHAHIKTSVPSQDLVGLDALIFAMTRSRSEWQDALGRRDELTLWGIGVHPGVPAAINDFESDAFRSALQETVLVGEVGLDGASRVPMARQQAVLDDVLAAVQELQRPVSIHSVRASRLVLDAIRRRPVAVPVLHWWRGNKSETEEAIEMGCFFSLNGAEANRPRVLELLPPDRVLTETDFPYSRRSDKQAIHPAATATIEGALADIWGLEPNDLRRRLWQTVGLLVSRCDIEDRLPPRVQDVLLTVGSASGAN
jgi:TatD DNase family protein